MDDLGKYPEMPFDELNVGKYKGCDILIGVRRDLDGKEMYKDEYRKKPIICTYIKMQSKNPELTKLMKSKAISCGSAVINEIDVDEKFFEAMYQDLQTRLGNPTQNRQRKSP